MNVSTWDRAKSIRAGFKHLETLAFDKFESQPFNVVRHGTEDQIKAFEIRLYCLPAKILLVLLEEAMYDVMQQVRYVIEAEIGETSDQFMPRWRAWKSNHWAIFFGFNENTPKDILAHHIIYRYRVCVGLL